MMSKNRFLEKRLLRHFFSVICLVILIAACLVHMFFGYTLRGRPGHAWGCDDAYISYRYAENFGEGKGLVYNEAEEVEGYSNFLYVLLMTPLVMISRGHIYLLSCLLNICFLIAGFWIFRHHVAQCWGEADSYLAGFLFALCPVLWVWTASGMETPLVLLIQISIWILSDRLSKQFNRREFILFAAAILVSVLSRADGFIFPLIAAGLFILRRRYKTAFLSLGVLGLVVLFYFGWRHWYYGFWLPNTYYVKVSGPLIERIRTTVVQTREVLFLKGMIVYLVLILAAVLYGRIKAKRNRGAGIREMESGAVYVFGLILYWLYIGGDVFLERFLIFIIPVGIFALFRCVRFFKDKLAIVGFPIVVLLFQFTPVLHDKNFDYRTNKYDQWVTLGKFLGDTHPGATLAIDAAGKVPYFSELYTIDMLGLNDLHIGRMESSFFRLGHNKFDPDYVMSRNPDLIAAWGHSNGDMRFGLHRAKYEEYGYALKYLVNTRTAGRQQNIIDVENASNADLKNDFEEGYQYFVLKKHEDG